MVENQAAFGADFFSELRSPEYGCGVCGDPVNPIDIFSPRRPDFGPQPGDPMYDPIEAF